MLEYTPANRACVGEAHGIAENFAYDMASGGFGKLYHLYPPEFDFERLFRTPADFGPLPWPERLEWPQGGAPRWVPDVPAGVGPPSAPLRR